jgi:3-dehydroquinate synthase
LPKAASLEALKGTGLAPNAQTIHVSLGDRSYAIEVGAGILPSLGKMVERVTPAVHAVVIADERIEASHAQGAARALSEVGLDVDVVLVESGEESKSVEMADQLWNALLERETDRKSIVVAVGGGVIGDLAGFVAATFARGLPFYQVPTTLLAAVDSSVGGKVGINLPDSKNMVGAFWQPSGVLIDTDTLKTLPEREYVSGLAEVVKYGVILDESFFVYLEEHVEALLNRDSTALREIIIRSCRLKADVVERDERETSGLRAVLNYGHTFGHALEAIAGYGEYLHGEAVSIGMECASRMALQLGRIEASFVERQTALLHRLGLPTKMPPVDLSALLDTMLRDKKVEKRELRFVLPTRLGHVELVKGISLESATNAILCNRVNP